MLVGVWNSVEASRNIDSKQSNILIELDEA